MSSDQQKNFKNFFQQQLNAAQQQAVEPQNGVLLVIAGAGSGKTRVITARISNLLITHHCHPSSIIALTFTNKAAREMKERIEHFLPNNTYVPFIGTFHSYCLWLLRKYGYLLGFDKFSILDADDQQQLLHALVKRNSVEKRISAKNLAYYISTIKNSAVSAEYIIPTHDPLAAQLMQTYEHEKKLSKCLDFDDLLLQVLKLLNNHEDIKQQLQQQIRHVLIDEYQDTNVAQHALIKKLTLVNQKKLSVDSLCAVGDEDQSIYSWRGATVANIINFKKDFPSTQVIKIEQNYRSVQPILDIANHVIQHNKQRNPKTLWSEKKASDRVRIVSSISGYQEGEVIAQFLKIIAQQKQSLSSCAILYRAHYQSRIIEETLIRHSIAYRIVGGIQFYERKEIKDILAYMRLIANPFDRVAFFRIINVPARGLGQKFEEEFSELWEQQPLYNFIDVAQELCAAGTLAAAKMQQLTHFVTIITQVNPLGKPIECIEYILQKTLYQQYLKDHYEPTEAQTKLDNIKELLRAAQYAQEQGAQTVTEFLNEVALMQEKASADSEHKEQQVQLMTLHAAKGLEFKTVILIGLEEGLFPSTQSNYSVENMEEERRLFYVGITRAQERLLLTYSRFRTIYGTPTDQRPSRFIQEISQHLAQKYDGSQWNSSQIIYFFNEWLGTHTTREVFTFSASTISKKTTAVRTLFNEEKKSSTKFSASWKKNQSVQHTKFGLGIIKEVETSGDDIFIIAQFKVGVKKVKASFLQVI